MRVAVVGAGVIGLSCALRLAERGAAVHVVTADLPADTTSVVAGGLVYPRHAEPADRCAAWTAASVAEFRRLAERPGTGVRLVPGRLLRRAPRPVPPWAEAVGGMRRVADPGGPWTDALAFTPPLVHTGRYLAWLADAVAAAGVRTERRRLRRLADAGPADLVVNAAGLGARELVPDSRVVPARGQVVHLTDPGLTEWVVDEDDFSYVLPHGDHVVCGGTEEPGNDDLAPDPRITEDILCRCRALVPELAGAEVLDARVGLRPVRPHVRVERAGDVVHCYGHGGTGVTLSWGCAEEVAELAA
ncbi:D-amino-acid oxidase [Amycolatopsis arida]|uniref:D-amino-acid oxidase n=1 Tax=Amycolatopsis arida TaxID=587909 RepID=A0A1I5ZUR4_9PSEU|nr:FAD-dependent oxidoreductase [Amycolatopsis arida]TDX89377.1 D-amino-acid oxidase [Amycolatopsis arida]SFQ60120.1 D-amino-acid oxidase [Amycolatopsis arida]